MLQCIEFDVSHRRRSTLVDLLFVSSQHSQKGANTVAHKNVYFLRQLRQMLVDFDNIRTFQLDVDSLNRAALNAGRSNQEKDVCSFVCQTRGL